MSRIGKMPIEVPQGVEVKIAADNVVTVKGSKGTLTQQLHNDMIIKLEDGKILVERPSDEKVHKSLHGLTRTLVNNMVEGVTKGFEKVLEINGVGYRAQKQGKKLVLTLGYSHPVEMEEPAGITVDVPTPNKLIVKGTDKQAVGEFAAKIRSKREPEVYKGKGIKYETEIIRRKEGKTGGKGKK
jgi:large subunit ribosomal protein L6